MTVGRVPAWLLVLAAVWVCAVKAQAPPPPVIEPISDETVLIGGNEAFFCDATGSADPNVVLEWSRTGEPLEDDNSVGSHIRIVLLFRTLLLLSIIDVGLEDAAIYTCTATNSDDVESTMQSVNLTVIGLPEFLVSLPLMIEVDFGQPLTLNCTAENHPQITQELEILWMLNGMPIMEDSRVMISSAPEDASHIAASQLIFASVGLSDPGTYTCLVHNHLPSDGITSETQLTVFVQPPEIAPIQDRNITIGETETITCTATSSVNVTLEWSRSGTLLVEETLIPTQAELDYRIANVGTADEGIYQCTATNAGGVTSQNTTLTVIGLPVFTMGLPVTTAVEHGDVFSLTCVAQNHPSVTQNLSFVWQFDGMDVASVSRVQISTTPENASNIATSELIFSPVQQSDSGNYTCLVHNRDPEDGISSTAELNVTAFPPVITEVDLPEDILGIVAGNNVTFAVVATGSTLMYQWQRNLVDLNSTGRFIGVDTAVLTISSVQEEDEGNYSCIVSNIVSNETSRSAELTVLDPPTIIMQPLNQTDVFPGTNVSFTVTVIGVNLSFSWEFDNGDPLPIDSRFIGGDTAVLTIVDVEEMDEGVYRCNVSNPAGTAVSESVQLIVYDPPNITNSSLPADQLDIPEGQTVMFTVEATGTDIEYQWEQDGNGLSDDVRFSGTNSSTLTITDVVEEDGGNYTCAVGNALGNVTSRAAELTVFGLPIISEAPMDIITELDSTVIITCVATGGGTLAVSWNTTANITLPAAREITSIETLNSSLNLTDVGAAYGGEYTCTATNEAGSARANASLYILPTIISQPVAILTNNGSVVSLQCEAEGFPEPSYQWRIQDLDESVPSDNFIDVEDAVRPTLEFNPVEFGDEGLYHCVAFSPVGNATSAIVPITISPDGSVVLSPVNGTFSRQENVNFSCSALGGLGNTFQWVRDGVELENETSGLLTLLAIDATSGGEYTCTVSNAAGNESVSAFLLVSPEILLQPVGVNTTNGSMAMLRCGAEAFPEPEYQWEHINGTIGDNVLGTNTDTLVFDPVLFGDEGDYLCTVNSNGIRVSSDTATVTVSPQGSVMVTPEEVLSQFGENVTFICMSQGGPGISYIWQKNGNDLPSETSETLVLNSVIAEDGGEYTCIVSNNAGSENATAVLYIMPRIVQNPSDILTRNGSTVNFTCIADGFPAPAYRWEMLGGSNSVSGSGAQEGLLAGIDMVTDPILEFIPAVFGDEGTYRCVVTSTLTDGRELIVESNATLTLSPEGSVVAFPTLANAERNATVTFTCRAEGGPSNTLTWTRLLDGETVSTDGVLTILVDSATDGSDYECLVENDAGSETVNITLNVAPAIPFPPVATNVTDTEDLILTCTTSGYPVPVVVMWTHNGTILDGNENRTNITEQIEDRALTSTLTVTETVISTDSGEYECIVTSPLLVFNNVTSDPVFVLVQNTPERPQNVTGEALNSTAIQLTWIEPHDNNAPISNYSISYNEPDFLNGTAVVIVVEFEMVVVTGLHPGVSYAFVVTAINGIGPSRPSSPAIVTTEEEAPSGLPQNVQATANSSTAVLVSWMPVLGIDQNGIIIMYEIQYEPLMTFDGFVEGGTVNTSSGTEFILLVTALEEFVEYNISVRAYTSVGPGPFSPTETERTLEDEPGIFPPDVQASVLSSTGALVTWELLPAVERNGIITNYNVRLEPLDFTEELPTIFMNSSNLSAVVTGLEEFVEYNISVRAYTSVGAGPFSPAVINRTFEDEPAVAPQNIEVFTLSSTVIVATWEEVPAIDQNGVITEYEVRINQSTFDEISLGDFAVINASIMALAWENLEEFVDYSIRIRAFTSVGPGPFSVVVSNRTLEDVPSDSPQNVSTQTLSSTEIIVTWEPVPPIDRNGIVTQYEVEFNQSTLEEIRTRNSTTVSGSVLMTELRGLEENVEYSIMVRAFTAAGSGPYSQVDQSVTLEAAPSNYPQQVEASSLSSTEILVTWDPVPEIDQNGIITTYEILYGPLITFNGLVIGGIANTTNGSESSLVITGLEEFVEYSIRMRAYTTVGPGPFSPVVSNTTFEDEPAAPPQNVNTVNISPTEIMVIWEEVPAIDQNGINTNYEVQIEPLQFTETLETMFVNATNTSVLVVGLEEYVEYNISVRAYTTVGAGPFSPAVAERTLEDAPSASPQDVQAVAVSSTMVMVNWENVPAIDQNGIITNYEVLFEPLEFTSALTVALLNATNMSVIFPNLEEFVEYNISVRAYTVMGPGPFSSAVENRTLEDVPATPPVNVRSTVLSSTAIAVAWEDVLAIDRNGILRQFEVKISQSTFADNPERSITTDASVFMLEWNDLEEFVEYNISVRAFTSLGPGPFSIVIMNRTFEDAPSDYPQNVSVLSLSPTEIRVTWKPVPLIRQNGIITQYEVEFNQSAFSEISLSNTTSVGGLALEVVLTGLEEVVNYSIRVRALTNEGPGPYSPSESATTLEAAPSDYPQNVNTFAPSSTEIMVAWDRVPEINENGIITTYEVQYEPQTTFDVVVVVGGVLNTSNTSLLLTGLEEFVEYDIIVRAYTSVGPGPFSPTVRIRTLEDEPATFPQNIQAFTVSSSMMMLNWEEVPAIDQNGIITTFEVFLEPLQFRELLTAGYVNTSDLSTIIAGLQEFVEYDISVRAYTSVGPGPLSPAVTNRTFEDVPAASPQRVQTTALSSNEITVTWEDVPAIDQNGILVMYEVRADPLQFSEMLTTLSVNATNMSTFITGLEEYVQYNISVRAYTSVGPGPYSPGVIDRTFENEPTAPPENLQIPALSSTEIMVIWEAVPAMDQNGIIITYEVLFEPIQFADTLTAGSVNTSQFSVVLTGLEEFVEYNISVRAYTIVGPGPFSPEETNRTLEAPLSTSPMNVTATVVSTTAIVVLWDEIPAIEHNSAIIQYEVLFSQSPLGELPVNDSVFTDASVLTVTLDNLEEFVEYGIRVRGITGAGPGPFSTTIFNTTFEDSPSSYPQDLELSNVTANEMLVTWNLVPLIDQNGIITEYEVEFNQSTFEEVSTSNTTTVNSSSLMLQLTDLEEFVEYSVRVRAFSSVGAGPYTPVERAKTLQGPPSTYPSNVRAFGIESTEILVVWSSIPEVEQNGVITFYEVCLEPLNFTDVLTTNRTRTVNRFQFFDEQQEFAVYSITVMGFTSIGPGPFSPPILVTTIEDEPAQPPQNVEALGISLTEIVVTWEEVPLIHQNGIITSYEVQYEALDFTESFLTGSVMSTELSLTLNDLEQDTGYNFSVRARTMIGFGPLSTEITTRTLNVPDQVRRPDPVAEEDLMATEATVRWNPPDNPNGEIVNYTVEFAVISTNFPAVPIRSKRQTEILVECVNGGVNRSTVVPGTQTSVTLTQLTPFSIYEFRVQAMSTLGIGLFSPSQTFETAEDVPSSPLNLTVRYLSSSALEVTWNHPLCDYGNRTNYTVEHTPQHGDIGPLGEVGSPGSPYILPPEQTNFTITDLTPNTEYLIKVHASTNEGFGEVASEINTTDEDAPQMVTGLTVTSRENPGLRNAVFIEIMWTALSLRNGSFDYNLMYTAEQRDPYPEPRRNMTQGSVIVNGDLDEFVITDGLPFAEYTMAIFGFNLKLGFPGPSQMLTERSEPLRPTAVIDLRATATSPGSIRVSWNFPEFPNGPIDHFSVYYKESDTVQQPPIENSGFTITSVGGTDLEFNISEDLAAYTNYAIHVQAFGSRGNDVPGEVIEEILQRTNSTTPSCDDITLETATTMNTISINLPQLDSSTGLLQFYGIIVIETRGINFDSDPPDPSEFGDAIAHDPSLSQSYYITAAWNDATQIPGLYVVGNQSSTTVDGNTYSNARLKSGEEYAILYRVEIVSDNDMPLECYSGYLIEETGSGIASEAIIGGVIGGFALVLLLLICIVWVLVRWIRQKPKSDLNARRPRELQVISNPDRKGEIYDDIVPDDGYLAVQPQPGQEATYAEAAPRAAPRLPERPSRIVTADENAETALALDDPEARYTPTPGVQRRDLEEVYDDINAETADSSQYTPMQRERQATPINADHTYATIPYNIQISPAGQ